MYLSLTWTTSSPGAWSLRGSLRLMASVRRLRGRRAGSRSFFRMRYQRVAKDNHRVTRSRSSKRTARRITKCSFE